MSLAVIIDEQQTEESVKVYKMQIEVDIKSYFYRLDVFELLRLLVYQILIQVLF